MDPAAGTTLTLLFTDVVSSTETSARLGADAAAARRHAHDRILREQFEEFGGTVVKNTGDGFFATFPSARQGVACASAIQAALAAQQEQGRYAGLSVRIGLHTGEPTQEDGDLFGLDVVIASRIMEQAGGGEVLLSDITYLLAKSHAQLQFSPAGERALKGIPQPVMVYRLEWRATATGGPSAFVGREAERARLAARLASALRGHGSTVLITGDGGLGKTRLASELAIDARDQGARVYAGRAYDTEGLPPYHVVLEALRDALRGRDELAVGTLVAADAGLLASVLPELATGTDGASALTPEAERYRLFEAIAGVFLRLAAEAPLLLLFDDLHWADRATVHLVQHLARRLQSAPVLIVGTFRDAEIPDDHPLVTLMDELHRSGSGERIALEPLSREDAAMLAEHALGTELAPATAVALYNAAEGNPFFTEELVRQLRDEKPGDAGRLRLPDTVRHLLLRRFERLDAQAREILSTCAVLGRDLTLPRIAAVADMADDVIEEALEVALDEKLLHEEHDGYAFAHPLMIEALYDGLRAPKRQRLHRAIASGLERLYAGSIESHLQELAHHHLSSGARGEDAEKAAELAGRAGIRAMDVYAYDEATTWFQRGARVLEASGGGESSARCELLLSLADARLKAGDAPAADSTFNDAAILATQLARPDLLARSAIGLGDVRRTGGIVDADLVALLERALDALGSGDSTLRAHLLARLTAAQYHVLPLDRLHDQALEATMMAERLGHLPTTIYVWRSVRLFLHEPHDVRRKLEDARELEALARSVPDRESSLYARHMQIDNLTELGEIDEADALMESFEAEARELRQPFYLWLAAVYRAMRAQMRGEWAEGERLAQAAFALGKEAQTETNLAFQFLAVQLFGIRLEQGRLGEMVDVVRRFVEEYPALRWRVALAFTLSEIGEEAEARGEFESAAANEFRDLPDDFNQSIALVFLSELCARFHDAPRAALLYERMLPYEGRNVITGAPAACAGAASRMLGMLAGVLERWDVAERHFQDALAMNERMGAIPLAARTRYAWAAMLLRRGDSAAARQAAALLDEAGSVAEQTGMVRLIAEISELRAKPALTS
jgi:class 3 adenylate cyclase